jgi:phosphate transport system substrate-binding protein
LDGGIGYVETAYVREPLQAAALTNASGQVLKPTPDAAATALAAIDLGPDLIGSDPNPKAGYPIVSFSWVLLYKTGNGTKLEGLQKVFDYTLSAKAQEGAGPLSYVPLPEAVLNLGRTAVQGLSK